jgi:hypothetical protein
MCEAQVGEAVEELQCKAVRLNLWDYAARVLPKGEHEAMDAHLDACRDCDRCLADVSSVRTGFRHMPVQPVPPLVATRLRVIASRERSRQLLMQNPGAWLRDKFGRAMMNFDNFLRPYAVPATGGLLTSCLCFSLIAHTLQLRPYLQDLENDMPIGLYTEMTVDDVSPFSFSKQDVTMELTVDADGAVTDVTPMLQGGSQPTSEELNQIASWVLYSTFTPAIRAGQRVSSKRLIAIRHFEVLDRHTAPPHTVPAEGF